MNRYLEFCIMVKDLWQLCFYLYKMDEQLRPTWGKSFINNTNFDMLSRWHKCSLNKQTSSYRYVIQLRRLSYKQYHTYSNFDKNLNIMHVCKR